MDDNTPIILDTDIGIDDAVAMAVLLKNCKERVKLVVTSYGNTPLVNATQNARAMLALLGADIPVLPGADRPRTDNARYKDASNIHGGDGLGGLRGMVLELSAGDGAAAGARADEAGDEADGDPPAGSDGDWVTRLYEAIAAEGRVDFITLGPLTNLSALLRRYPEAAERIRSVVTMGGALGMGNITPFAEFNLYCDAESADHVFGVARGLTLVPLNVTTRVAFGLPAIAEIGAAGTRVARAMSAVLRECYHNSIAYGESGAVMHDATAVLTYLYPRLFGFRAGGVRVECGGERYGESVFTAHGGGIQSTRDGNIKLAADAEPERLLRLIADSLTGDC